MKTFSLVNNHNDLCLCLNNTFTTFPKSWKEYTRESKINMIFLHMQSMYGWRKGQIIDLFFFLFSLLWLVSGTEPLTVDIAKASSPISSLFMIPSVSFTAFLSPSHSYPHFPLGLRFVLWKLRLTYPRNSSLFHFLSFLLPQLKFLYYTC